MTVDAGNKTLRSLHAFLEDHLPDIVLTEHLSADLGQHHVFVSPSYAGGPRFFAKFFI